MQVAIGRKNIKKQYKNFRYIKICKGFAWPYSPNLSLMKKVDGLEQWLEVQKEFEQFFDNGDELNVGPCDRLLMKMRGVYVATRDTFYEERIKNREKMDYIITDDLFLDNGDYKFKDKQIIGVTHVFKDLEETMNVLRKYWNLGYETIIRDLWKDGQIVDIQSGWRIK